VKIGLVSGDGLPVSGLLTVFRNVFHLGQSMKLFDDVVVADLGYSWRSDKARFFPNGPNPHRYPPWLRPTINSSIAETSPAGSPSSFTWFYQGPSINADANAATLLTSDQAIQQVFNWFTANGGANRPVRSADIPGVNTLIGGSLDSPNSINNRAMADRLAATLGDRPAALMKAHGGVTVGKDIVEAFVLANYMEENAYRQYMALQIGKPYVFSEEEIAMCREKLWNATLFNRTWDHFRAKLY